MRAISRTARRRNSTLARVAVLELAGEVPRSVLLGPLPLRDSGVAGVGVVGGLLVHDDDVIIHVSLRLNVDEAR